MNQVHNQQLPAPDNMKIVCYGVSCVLQLCLVCCMIATWLYVTWLHVACCVLHTACPRNIKICKWMNIKERERSVPKRLVIVRTQPKHDTTLLDCDSKSTGLMEGEGMLSLSIMCKLGSSTLHHQYNATKCDTTKCRYWVGQLSGGNTPAG